MSIESGGYFGSNSAEDQPMEPKPRNCNVNCPGNIDHKTPVSIISRVNYRLAHNVLSLSADDEQLLRDTVFCVMELVAKIELLKEQNDIYVGERDRSLAREKELRSRSKESLNAINDLLKTIQVREETISFLREELHALRLRIEEKGMI